MEPIALQYGIRADEYWSMTFSEIMMQVQANKKSHENELKEKAMFDYNQAHLISYAFNKPEKMPNPDEVYSFLKDTEEIKSDKPKEITEYNMSADQAILLQRAAIVTQNVENKEKE